GADRCERWASCSIGWHDLQRHLPTYFRNGWRWWTVQLDQRRQLPDATGLHDCGSGHEPDHRQHHHWPVVDFPDHVAQYRYVGDRQRWQVRRLDRAEWHSFTA